MIPVDMVIQHDPPYTWGDCTRACIASIFELPASAVPHFISKGEEEPGPDGVLPWCHRFRDWLAEQGYAPLFVEVQSEEQEWSPEALQFHYLRSGKTRRGTVHDTVWFGGRMVHDPQWRDRSGLLRGVYPQHMTLLVKL